MMKEEKSKRTWIVCVSKQSSGKYIQIGYRKEKGNGYETRFGIGYEHDYLKYQKNPIENIKKIIKDIPLTTKKEKIIEIINEKVKNNQKNLYALYERYKGLDVISTLND
ncbi:IS1634 family transposase, partial [Mycoplasmopsis pullorum]